MKEWLFRKNYPEKVVNDHIDKSVFSKNPPIKKSLESGISFEVTYYPKVKNLSKLTKD